MFREAFIKTQRYYGITAKEIHELCGVSRNHLSEYKNGKRDMTTESLAKILAAMDEIAPGARKFFAEELAGARLFSPKKLAGAMNDEEKAEFLFAIANNLRAKVDTKQAHQSEIMELMSF